MKYIILTFIIITFSCKERKLVNNEKIINNKIAFYDIILNELENIDTSKFYISYEIKKDFNITNEISESIKNIDLLSNKEKEILGDKPVFEFFTIELSKKIKEIINNSKKNRSKKIELNYQFSYPYLINENKVLIINTVKYRNPITKDVKAGSERAIILGKADGSWKIVVKTDLIDI